MSFSLIIPIYNEEDNIKILIEQINTSLNNKNYNHEIIFIKDGITDDSYNVLIKLKQNNISIITNDRNYGQSYSLMKGIKIAKNDLIVIMDGNLQNNPIDIIKLLNIYLKNNFNLVGGIRNKRKDSKLKIISSYIANFIRQIILKDDYIDTGCSLKVFEKKIFLSLPYFDRIHRLLPALFKEMGYKTYFTNVDHRPRFYGKSKYGTLLRLIWGIRDIIRVIIIIKKLKNHNA